jgi:hypothetical protein
MFLPYLFLLPLGVLASPVETKETHQLNRERLSRALVYFGKENFTWPVLDLKPVYHPSLKTADETTEELVADDDVSLEPKTELELIDELDAEEFLENAPETEFNSLSESQNLNEGPGEVVDELSNFVLDSAEAEESTTFSLPANHPLLNMPTEPPTSYKSVLEETKYLLHHEANDDPVDPEKDVYHITTIDIARPICSYFQHSVLGEDFGESTFPRVSYVSSAALPFRVHYAPGDDLRFESYKWPFAACNHACELQALQIRAMFDWELDPVNGESNLNDDTKQALMVAREICQWKNVHHHFAVDDCTGNTLRKRSDDTTHILETKPQNKIVKSTTTSQSVSFVCQTPPPAVQVAKEVVEKNLPEQKVRGNNFQVSDAARSAMQEIQNILSSTYSPQDLAQMFHTVVVACKIHRYTVTPMEELQISTTGPMVQQAMAQIGRVFADTQGRINVWETRDAIVRATQIYRYQQEHS